MRHHFIRDAIAKNEVILDWVSSEKQIADILTKGLGATIFNRLVNQIVYLP